MPIVDPSSPAYRRYWAVASRRGWSREKFEAAYALVDPRDNRPYGSKAKFLRRLGLMGRV